MAFPTTPTNGQVTVVNQVSYQYSSATNSWTRILSTANVITANTIAVNGNLTVGVDIVASGNITADYYFGNGSQLTGVAAATAGFPITAGNSNIAAAANSNIAITVTGTPNVAVFAPTGEYVTGVVSASGTVTGGNLATSGTSSAAGNITGGNVLTGGLISATGTITGSSLLGSVVSASGNVTGGNVLTGGLISATSTITSAANITGGNLITTGVTQTGNFSITGNVIGNLLPSANATYSLGGPGQLWKDLYLSGNTLTLGDQTLSSNATAIFTANNFSSNNLAATNAVLAGTTVSAVGNVIGGNVTTVGQVSATSTVTGGNLATGGTASAAGNITGGNILTGGLISATSTITSAANVTGGNLATGGTASATGNITGGNILTGGQVSATGNATFGNISTSGSGGNISGANVISSTTLSATANVIGGNITTAGLVSATGNVSGNYILGNGAFLSGVITSVANINNGTSNVTIATANANVTVSVDGTSNVAVFATTGEYVTGVVSASGTVTGGNIATSGTSSAAGNITGGNILTGGLISSTGTITSAANVTGGNLATGGTASAAGTVTGGNLATGGTASATGNITGGNVLTGGLVSSAGNITGGNLLTGGLISSTGTITTTSNISGGNLLTSGLVSVTGNVIAGNINSSTIRPTSGELTISTASGNLNLNPAGNIVLTANTWINNLAYPAQNADAATKEYVDNFATTAITYHQPVVVATTTTLATTTGGTITYAQPNGVANGVGATLTTTGSFNLIDTGNVQSVGTRILVKDQANAVQNGVYTWANATAIVRSTDTDEYGSNSTSEISINDYFFTTGGNVNAGTAFIVSAPAGVITFGTSNIAFSTFSTSPIYSANSAAGLSLNGTVFSAKVDNTTTAFDGTGNIVVKASANLTTPNIGAATGTSLNVTANVTGGNILTGGLISAAGNISGGNVAVTGASTAASYSATGNVTGGNVLTGGLISSTGTITSAANVTGGNLATGGTASAAGTVTGGNLATGGTASAAGNITGGNVLTGGITSAAGNITGGNLLTGGLISSTGNVTGNYILGNGAFLTGVITSVANINNGTSNVNIAAANANITVSVDGTSNVAVFATTGEYVTGVVSATGTITGGNLATGGTASAAGNITGGNLLTGGLISATSTITSAATITGGNIATGGTASAAGNITGGNVLTGGLISATGNITGGNANIGGNLNVTSSLTVSSNGTYGNVVTTPFASVFATAAGANPYSIMQVRSNDGISGMGMQAYANINGLLYSNTGITIQTGATLRDKDYATSGVTRVTIDSTGLTANGIVSASGNVTGGNVLTGGLISSTGTITGSSILGSVVSVSGNITGGNISSTGLITTTGNIAGGNILTNNYYYANGQAVAFGVNYTAATTPPSGPSNGWQWWNTSTDVLYEYLSDGTSQYWVDTTSPAFSNGPAGNLAITGNLLVAVNNAYDIGASGQTFRNVYATNYYGNGASLSGIITSVSNINNGTTNMTVVSSGGNIAASVGGTSNIMVISSTAVAITGDLSVSGNATLSGNILGDRIQNGTTLIDIQTINGNANITIGGVSNVAVFSTDRVTIGGNVLPSANITYDLGTSTQRWKDLWLSNSTIYLGNSQISANATAVTITNPAGGTTVLQGATPSITGSVVSASGNITGGNILTGGLISATGNIFAGNIIVVGGFYDTGDHLVTSTAANANIILTPTGTGITQNNGAFSASGNVTGGNVTTAGVITVNSGAAATAIVNGAGNAVGNIGSSGTYFNRLFAQATTALYADLAEMYVSDAEYDAGTVVDFDGEQEITISNTDSSKRVAGVISTNPAHLMNSGIVGDITLPVALIGRVPVKVTGVVRKGDLMVSAGNGRARAVTIASPKVGTIIGKALENFSGGEGTIELVIGKH